MPLAPTNLVATATGAGQITLHWVLPNSSQVTSIAVRRGNGANCPTTASAGTAIGGPKKRNKAVDGSVKDGARYCYTVFAVNGYGNAASHTSAVVSPPARVTGVTAVASGSKVLVSWKAAAGATGYVVAAAPAGSCPRARTAPATSR